MTEHTPRIQPEPDVQGRPQPAPGQWNYDDYCAIGDEENLYEIIDGELYMQPSPTEAHQRALTRLAAKVEDYLNRFGIGEAFARPLDVVLSPRNVVQPDLLFVAVERLESIEDRGVFGAPDLVVEVMTAGTAAYDREVKGPLYARHGVRWLWLIDPVRRTVEELELRGGAYVAVQDVKGRAAFRPAVFPSLSLPLAELWG